ncbi:WxL domain-containing protein [Candidatus Enterococcus moelleringii]|uniref:WxL domain-containing protein n=1 Tax=Candidatus Enterococcus moelleringii TaxID=2815325 RepID=UPI002418B0C8|nr:WxL domain-containing protein [Enterococcus sp. 669A]
MAEESQTSLSYQVDSSTVIRPLDPLAPDPTKPIVPADPVDPAGPTPGTGGIRSIDYASSFQFGKQGITTTDQTYYAQDLSYQTTEGAQTSGPNFVQVSDLSGTGSGWILSVKQNQQFHTTANQELKNAELAFLKGEVVSNVDQTYAPQAEEEVVFRTIGEEKNVVTANANQGTGTWLYRFGQKPGDQAVQLKVPGSSVKYAKEYRTSLTWALKNVPGNQ